MNKQKKTLPPLRHPKPSDVTYSPPMLIEDPTDWPEGNFVIEVSFSLPRPRSFVVMKQQKP